MSRSEEPKLPQDVIEAQVVTYNNRDLEGYMALFHDDVKVYTFPEILSLNGKAQVHERYAELFKEKPLNFTKILNRTVLGDRVLDHEIVYREGPSGKGSEMIAIYDVQDGLIKRIDFISSR